MALQQVPGGGLWIPRPIAATGSITSSVIDATGEKFAWTGFVFNKDRTTKSIRTLGFLFGTVTKAGGSALTASLQNVSAAAGAPMQPDETQDQTVAIANADAGFVTNAWYTTGNLSADRSVAFGEAISVVIEYDGGGRLGADTVALRNYATPDIFGGAYNTPSSALKTASWAGITVHPNIILGFSDGTFGTLAGGFPFSASTVLSYKQDTAGTDEWALDFTLPFPCKVDGWWGVIGGDANTADFDVILYDGTTPMTGGSVSYDAMWLVALGTQRMIYGSFSQEISLSANTAYKLAVQPTQTTSNVRLFYFDVSAAGHMQAHDGGANFLINGRINAGAWAGTTTTRRPLLGLRVSSLDDAVSAGGGGGGGRIIGGGM